MRNLEKLALQKLYDLTKRAVYCSKTDMAMALSQGHGSMVHALHIVARAWHGFFHRMFTESGPVHVAFRLDATWTLGVLFSHKLVYPDSP